MTGSRVTRISEQRLQVSGIVDFDNALDLRQQGERLISKAADHCEVDFSRVTKAGSAALTLLFSWLRHSVNVQKTLVFTNLPDDLLGVAQVSGVDQILPVK